DIINCINEKKKEHQRKYHREEVLTFGVHAAKGKPLQCNTSTASDSQLGEGPRDNEELDGNPDCTVVNARIMNRAKITSCSIINNKPYLSAQAQGEGCKKENSATFKLVQKYKVKTSTMDDYQFAKQCEERMAK
ncbi:hypothetical protein, partial [Vibrio sp. V36_P2S2PM302]